MKLYLAGPMTGLPFFNFPAFHEAEAALEEAGYAVWSPARYTEGTYALDFASRYPTGDHIAASRDGFDLRLAMEWNIRSVCRSDALALLPGHENSKGTQVEIAVARLLGIPAEPLGHFLKMVMAP